jgi:hypothetical protein
VGSTAALNPDRVRGQIARARSASAADTRGRLCGYTEDAHAPGVVLDHRQDGQGRAGQGLGLEEVGGRDRFGLGAQEVGLASLSMSCRFECTGGRPDLIPTGNSGASRTH